MADRATRHRVVDAVFVTAVLATGFLAYAYGNAPAMPDDVCETTGGPRYSELLADGRITIAAVLGELNNHGRHDFNAASARTLATGLRARGFVETAPSHFEAGELVVDFALYPHDNPRIGRALTEAFATHELVYFTGHSDDGEVPFSVPADYRIALLDTCWSTQLYSARVIGPDHDVIGNSDRSVTGSIDSLLVAIDALRARAPAWQPVLDTMNARSEARARIRAPISRYKAPEHYRLDSSCHGKSARQHASR